MTKFIKTNNREMLLEEMIDFAKNIFTDRKFIDTLAKFCVHEEDQVAIHKLEALIGVLEKLPMITSKDVNVSTAMKNAI